MIAFLETIDAFASAHQGLAYGLAFLMAMAEALPLVGTVIPGSVLIVALGALVPGGALALLPLLAAALAGAVSGDGASYWLGHRYREDLIRVWPFRRYPGLIAKGEALFRAGGGKAVFLSRFVQGPRAFVPLAAGILGMRPVRFFATNIASALIWAPSHVLAGALVGGSIALAGAVAGRLAALAILAILLVWFVLWLARRALGLAPRVWSAVGARALAWAAGGTSRAHRGVAALFDPRRRETLPLVALALLLLLAGWGFFGILQDITAGDPLIRADVAVYHFLRALRTPWADRFFVAVTELGDGFMVLVMSVAILAWLVWRRAWRATAYWLAGMLSANLLVAGLKLALRVPRPIALYESWSAYSFPSGHATMSVVFWGLVSVFVAREIDARRRPWVFAASALLASMIAFSRLYLGAHWLSDVLGGLALGTALVALLAVAYLRHRPAPIAARRFIVVMIALFATVGAAHVARRLPGDMTRYAAQIAPSALALARWRDEAWRTLPARRIDLGGELEEPLTLQWAARLDRIERALSRAGWRRPPPWTAQSALSWLGPRAVPGGMPVLPRLHDGRFPALTMIKTVDAPGAGTDTRRVIRLWPTDLRLTRAEQPPRALWLGELVVETITTPFRFVAVARTAPDDGARLKALARSLAAQGFDRYERRRGPGDETRTLLVLAPGGKNAR